MLNCQVEKIEKFKCIKPYVKNLSLGNVLCGNCPNQEVI